MGRLFKIQGFFAYSLMIFLNAFIDLGHKIVIQNTILKVYDGQTQIILIAIVNALILLPFVLLFTPAGFLSDKYPKNRVMRVSAWAAVALTCFITLFYYLGWFWPAFTMTFLMAMQSAFFSPAKYGYIKELTGKDKLAVANGMVQAITTIAILSGIFFYSVLFERLLSGIDYSDKPDVLRAIAPLGWILILNAVMELGAACLLPQKQAVVESMRFDMDQYKRGVYLRNNISTVFEHEVILLSIIGLSIFWGISQVIIAAFPVYAEETMRMHNTAIIQGMMACAGIGIMIGSLIAGRFSKDHIETGMIPIGSFGVAACLICLPAFKSVMLLSLNFIALGMFGGLFIIPLNALIQFHAGEHKLGRVLAGNNLIQNVVMLSFLTLTVVFAWYGIGSIGLFAILAVVAVAGAVFTTYKLPQSLVRFLVSFAVGRKYHLEVRGMSNMPETGGVLLLGHPANWMDWAVLQMATPRPIRLVTESSIDGPWYLKVFLDFFGLFPVSAESGNFSQSSIARLLDEGQVVCLLPRGSMGQSGQATAFQHECVKAATQAEGIILPFYIRGLPGNVYSGSSNSLTPMRGNSINGDIIVAFGSPLSIHTGVHELEKYIHELCIDSW